MKRALHRLLRSFLIRTRLCLLPVRVRSGIAEGARWTLYPWSAYWRGAHEPAMQNALVSLGDIRGWNCWDLGAHFGIYSIGLARRVGPTGTLPLIARCSSSHFTANRKCAASSLCYTPEEIHTHSGSTGSDDRPRFLVQAGEVAAIASRSGSSTRFS